MKLKLYSSRGATPGFPNLVSVQHPALETLNTVLVCPLKPNEAVTNVRAALKWRNETFTVFCDLVRPIHRNVLIEIGEADEATSQLIIEGVLKLLALGD